MVADLIPTAPLPARSDKELEDPGGGRALFQAGMMCHRRPRGSAWRRHSSRSHKAPGGRRDLCHGRADFWMVCDPIASPLLAVIIVSAHWEEQRIRWNITVDISAHTSSLADGPRRAIWVTRLGMRREDRSSISFSSSSQTSVGIVRRCYVIAIFLADAPNLFQPPQWSQVVARIEPQ